MSASRAMLLAVATWLGVLAAGQNIQVEVSHCTYSGSYADGSQYEKNLAKLLATLSSAAAASNGSFQSGSVGTAAPDQASGLVMCYAGRNATRCQDCLQKFATTGGLSELCPDAANSRKVWFVNTDGGCLLRYADAPFFGSANTDVTLNGWRNSGDYVDVTDMASLNMTRWRLLSQLAEKASHDDQPLRRLAYGSLAYTDAARNGSQTTTTTVYGLAQCTGDLEPSECARCPMEYVATVSSDGMGNTTIGSAMGYSCYMRYQLDDPIVPAPSPQPAPAPSGAATTPAGSKQGSRTPLIAALAAAAGAVMLLVAGV